MMCLLCNTVCPLPNIGKDKVGSVEISIHARRSPG
jgi:hypothetical protein